MTSQGFTIDDFQLRIERRQTNHHRQFQICSSLFAHHLFL
jgi:hypothetical protein